MESEMRSAATNENPTLIDPTHMVNKRHGLDLMMKAGVDVPVGEKIKISGTVFIQHTGKGVWIAYSTMY